MNSITKILIFFFYISLSFNINAQNYINTSFEKGSIFFKIKDASTIEIEKIDVTTKNHSLFSETLIQKYGIVQIEKLLPNSKHHNLSKIYEVKYTNETLGRDLIEYLLSLSYIEYAHFPSRIETYYTPNDPLYSRQWSLDKINASSGWDIRRFGISTIKIAVIDNSFNMMHSELASSYILPYDAADIDTDPSPPSTTGWNHGTHCAGIIGALNDNSNLISSIAGGVSIIPIKASSNSGSESTLSSAAIVRALDYANTQNADIVSMSFGSNFEDPTISLVISTLVSNGIVLVAAAGNSNSSSRTYPASLPGVIAVGATDYSDHKASFSNYGSWVDISAPGVNILSTANGSSTANIELSGTSMACPLVAGLCGLLLSNNPSMTATDIENCIKNGSNNIDRLNPAYTGLLGSGRINTYFALRCLPCNIIADYNASIGTSIASAFRLGSAVTFTATGGGSTHQWYIDGTNHTGAIINHTFTTTGYFPIMLVSSNLSLDSLCRDTLYRSITIYDTIFAAPCSPLYNTNWKFGDSTGINFRYSPPLLLTNTGARHYEDQTVASDKCGNIIFFVRDTQVVDRLGQVMPNNRLEDGMSVGQKIIIPNITNPNKYYILYPGNAFGSFSTIGGLNLYEVDMSAMGNGTVFTGPLGDVIYNTKLNTGTKILEKIAATKHANGRDYWVIAHGCGSLQPNRFYVYLANDSGFTLNRTVDIGANFTASYQLVGQMKISTDGKKLALGAWYLNGQVELFDFDNNTGNISNKTTVISSVGGSPKTFGIEFSPNNQLLYLTRNGILYQYDINLNTLSTVNASGYNFWGLQLGPNNQIYATIGELPTTPSSIHRSMNVITNPNININGITGSHILPLGISNIILPSGTKMGWTFCTTINSNNKFSAPFISHNLDTCIGNSIKFNADYEICDGFHSSISWHWEFGDGYTSNSQNPEHIYTIPGDYIAKLTVSSLCDSQFVTTNIKIADCCTNNLSGKIDSIYKLCFESDSLKIAISNINNINNVTINGLNYSYNLVDTFGIHSTLSIINPKNINDNELCINYKLDNNCNQIVCYTFKLDTCNNLNILPIDYFNHHIKIYPNPFIENLYIDFENDAFSHINDAFSHINVDNQNNCIKVYSSEGKILYTSSIKLYNIIQLEHLQDGLYIIKIITDKNPFIYKIIKQ